MGSTHTDTNSNSSIRSVDRALDLLTVVCSEQYSSSGCSLVDCAKTANLSPSTALRFLRSLTQRGFVSRDEDGMFHAGTELLRLGASVLSRSNLMRIAMPAMRSVVGDINESVYLAVRNAEGDCLYIAIEECSQAIRHVSWVGKSIPARSSAA
ncbi:IclR family transcriptional regulator, partial [Bifidobacterium tibiigranuli]